MLRPLKLLDCAFADDLIICAEGEVQLSGNLIIWEEELAKQKINI